MRSLNKQAFWQNVLGLIHCAVKAATVVTIEQKSTVLGQAVDVGKMPVGNRTTYSSVPSILAEAMLVA